jgi:6,7-dimethyl-8-ribityllumazine synthase
VTSKGSHVQDDRGSVEGAGLRLAILVSRFNADITGRLLLGARACLEEHGADAEGIDVYHVPGAWELPQAAARIVRKEGHDAVITLGCVIRGETPHFDYVCDEANRGLGAVARRAEIPVVFGVLTTENHEQARARAGDGPSNKGYEVALAALQMVAFRRRLEAR